MESEGDELRAFIHSPGEYILRRKMEEKEVWYSPWREKARKS